MAGYKGKQGRKPVPRALRILRGNPGKRPLKPTEPTPVLRLPSAPKQLSPAAKKEWRRTGRRLLAMGLMSEVDEAAFAAYCQSYARWLEMQAMIQEMGVLAKEPGTGAFVLNPLLRVAREAQEQFTRALTEFGMTPSSRTRMHGQTKEEKSEFEEFLSGSNAG